jgi:long-chain acyl-CoA synthetase
LSFDNLASVVDDIEKVIGMHVYQTDITLTFLPFSHIFGKIEAMATYHFGWQMYFAESIDKLFTNIGEVRPTLLFAVPRVFEKAYNKIKTGANEGSEIKKLLFHWATDVGREYYEHIWNHRRPPLKSAIQFKIAQKLVLSKVYAKFGGRLRWCVAGGAPLPLEVAKFMQIVGMTILEGYGLTETCAPVSLNTPDACKFGSIGKPLPEAAIKLGPDGELLIKSRKIFKEYYKNPEATAEVMENGWFHTGDIGTIDPEGFVKITDRKKDLIITSGGKNVAPQKIENLLKTQRYMNQIMVVGDKRNYLAAIVTLDKEDVIKYAKENNILFSEYSELVKTDKVKALVQKAVDHVNGTLASFESVKRFRILPYEFTIDGGEITPSLKLKRKACNEKYKSMIDEIYGTAEIS